MELLLPAGRGAVATARRWTGACARELGVVASVIPVIELLTSELVANAVLHGAMSDISLRVALADGVFTVSVTDDCDDLPVARTTGPEVPGGHGVRLVERLSLHSGVEAHTTGGKTVWFSVASSEAGPSTTLSPAG